MSKFPDHIQDSELLFVLKHVGLEDISDNPRTIREISTCKADHLLHKFLLTKGLITAICLAIKRFWKRKSQFGIIEVNEQRKCEWLKFALIGFCSENQFENLQEDALEKAFDDANQFNLITNGLNYKCRVILKAELYEFGKSVEYSEEFKNAEKECWEERENEWHDKQGSNFQNLKFSTDLELFSKCERVKCESCKKNVHLYCPLCVSWRLDPAVFASNPKSIELPLEIDIIAWEHEWKSYKCTAAQSCVVASEFCHWVKYPEESSELDSYDHESTLVLYPSDSSVSISSHESIPFLKKCKRLIVVDSTCNGAKKIMRDSRILNFQAIRLETEHTTFWKFTKHGPSFLATIEAIYYFLRGYYSQMSPDCDYDGRFDDLMMLYMHQLLCVKERVDSGKQKPLAWKSGADGIL
jgi:DTW domain-containing protein YfiP